MEKLYIYVDKHINKLSRVYNEASNHKVLILLKSFKVALLEEIFIIAIIAAFAFIFLPRFFNKIVSEENKKIKRIINFFYTPKNYIENFSLNDIDDPQFKIVVSVFLIAIFLFSFLFLIIAIILILSYKIEFQYIILKYFGLAFSGLIVIGTIGMTIAIAHELKDNKEKETSKEINAAKHFLNRIKIHIEHLERISQDLIFYEKQSYPLNYERISKILNNLRLLPSTIIDTPEYNPEFLYLIKNPCFHSLEQYYNYFSILNEDRKRITSDLLQIYKNILDMQRQGASSNLENISNEHIKSYINSNPASNEVLRKFIESYVITIFFEQTPEEHSLKFKAFIESPMYIITIGYQCLFCIMEHYNLRDDDILKNYEKIKKDIQEIDLKIKNENLKTVITKSLVVIKEIDKNIK